MLDHFINSAPSVCRHLRSHFPFLHDFLLGNIWPKKIFRIQEAHKVFSFGFVSKQNIQYRKWDYLFSPQLISAEETRLRTAAPQDPAAL